MYAWIHTNNCKSREQKFIIRSNLFSASMQNAAINILRYKMNKGSV